MANEKLRRMLICHTDCCYMPCATDRHRLKTRFYLLRNGWNAVALHQMYTYKYLYIFFHVYKYQTKSLWVAPLMSDTFVRLRFLLRYVMGFCCYFLSLFIWYAVKHNANTFTRITWHMVFCLPVLFSFSIVVAVVVDFFCSV